MELKFQLAKNKEKTVTVNNYFLHSSYNPTNEAKRFVELISIPFSPTFIIVIEPAISYCLPFMRERFPNSKIGVIRFSQEFIQFNSNFDFYLDYINNKSNFENYLNMYFNESQLLQTFFLSWTNSQKVFINDYNTVSLTIKKVLTKARTILVTRQYFEKKWLLNSINYCKYTKNFVSPLNKIDKPILIFSSGPSSSKVIPYILKFRDKLFLICLSSAISVCDYYHIIPDLYMSTDGGYWAGQHLKKISSTVPVALPTEAFCNKSVLQNYKILPLIYSDSIITPYITNTKIKYSLIQRNGTVAGSAINFAIRLNNYPLFITGIDLCNQKGFQHAQPNELEINNCINDTRIITKENRLAKSEFSSTSIDIYKSWFENYNPYKKVYRIIEINDKKNTLGKIEDISSKEFEKLIKKYQNNDTIQYTTQKEKINCSNLLQFIESIKQTELWENQLFPLDLVSFSHNKNNIELKTKIQKRSDNIFNKIRKILNG